MLLDKGAAVDIEKNAPTLHASSESPLQCAIAGGHEAIVPLLLAKGADVKILDRLNGESLLHRASGNRRFAGVVQQLLAKGADPNVVAKDGETALFLPAMWGYVAIVELLLEAGADATLGTIAPLYYASQNGHSTVVRMILDKGAHVFFDFQQPDGATALYVAVERGHDSIVQLLLVKGCSVNVTTKEMVGMGCIPGGGTSLHLAAYTGRSAIMRMLLACEGADIDLQTVKDG
jgi:ankyrin repeat protein